MEIFIVCVIVMAAFIIILLVVASNTGDEIKPMSEKKPQQPEVSSTATPSWDNGDYAMCLDVAGINKHECTFDYVGPFEGYIEADPDNEFDPNAIKVMHHDGAQLGYIKAAETELVRQLFYGKLDYSWPVVGYIKHIIRPGSIWDNEKEVQQQLKENGYFVARIYIDNKTLCEF